jgi:hypothetical protein
LCFRRGRTKTENENSRSPMNQAWFDLHGGNLGSVLWHRLQSVLVVSHTKVWATAI